MKRLEIKGITFAEVTLHVGLGTFNPVEVEDLSKHKMDSEEIHNPFDGWTNKFIFPPYDFSVANAMITNFHTPKSTLLMMVSAFAGHDLIMRAYKEAVEQKYKFYSYGDAMLIL